MRKRKKVPLKQRATKVIHQLVAGKLMRFVLWFIIWVITTAFKNGGRVSISDMIEIVLKVVEDGLSDVFK